MGSKQIRTGQLIAPFGPGSLYTDRRGIPHVICGLDHWFMRYVPSEGMVECEHRSEFQILEPRLTSLLKVDRFYSPPDFRTVRRGSEPPPNAMLQIPALRFPTWYRHTATGELRKFNLESVQIPKPSNGGRWQPVRFVSVCASGHLDEFPWKEWIGCSCTTDEGLRLFDRGGSELSTIRVECRTCPPDSVGHPGRSLSGTTINPRTRGNGTERERSAFEQAGIRCNGDRPWLGEGAAEGECSHPRVGALINQSNLYFARTISALLLPDMQQQDDEVIRIRAELEKEEQIPIFLTQWRTGNEEDRQDVAASLQRKLERRQIHANEDLILRALHSLFEGALTTGAALTPENPESELLAFRRAEFNIIRNRVDDRDRIQDLRVIPSAVPADFSDWLARVNLVERLRETRAFYGFSRLEPDHDALAEMPDAAMMQLFRNPPQHAVDRWLPAIEVFGEGIYIELDEQRILDWQNEHEGWLRGRLDDGFITRLADVFQTLPPSGVRDWRWASRYLLVHGLAHILVNQLVFECGYSTAALRERLYVSPDNAAPMAGFLIYTAAGDSEGTMGGLVSLGSPQRLGPAIQRALSRASWCSADPVCSENLGGQGSRLANHAACHACILLPETSCETINQGLDRAMIVGTPHNRQPGFMSAMLRLYGY